MAFDDIPYALNSVRDIEPGANAIELNTGAHLAGFVEQAYAFFAETGPFADDLGPKKRNAAASGTAWKPNPTVGGFGVKLAGSTGYFAAVGHQLRPWSRECLFVYGATGAQTISSMAEDPGSATEDRKLYVNGTPNIAAYLYDGGLKIVTGTTSLSVGQAYHAVVTCSNSLMSVYLNGVFEGSVAVDNAGFQGYTTPELVFGFNSSGGSSPTDTLNTLLYHIEYNSVLSATDVMHRYLNQMEMFQAARPRIMVGAGLAAYFLNADPASFGITGVAAGAVAGRMVAADAVAYALTGFNSAIPAGRAIAADPASYAIAGIQAGVIADRVIDAAPASFSITGLDAGIVAGRALSADPGALVITGAAADLVYTVTGAYSLNADPAVFSVTGSPAGTVAGRVIDALAGGYAITGLSASIVAGRALSADPVAYMITGANAGVLAGRIIGAEPGVYTVTGASAAAIAARLLDADPGAYVITGLAATFATGLGVQSYAAQILIMSDAREIIIIDDAREIVVD